VSDSLHSTDLNAGDTSSPAFVREAAHGAPAQGEPLGDLSPDEFRRAAHAAVDWIADYLEHPERVPVRAPVRPGDVAARLPASPPAQGEPLTRIAQDFHDVIVPGITHWNHPAFFGYFSISGSYPGILGELFAAGLNVNNMLWLTSPAATELELRTVDWLRQLMGLGDGWFGEITDTASTSTLYALAAAREAIAPAVRARGLQGQPALRVYCSEHAHSSVDKAVITLGLGHENLVKIPVDESFRLRPDALRAAIAADVAAGHRPMAVVATVGTTSTSSVDPVAAIVPVARDFGCWMHVDAAYGGPAAIVPELRWLLDGVDGADSLVVNPHKWLFTPVDCSVLYTKRPDVLKGAFSLVAEYLRTRDDDAVVNLMDYGFQLGRRFRSLKLWMVLRAFGAEGIAERLRHHCELAREFAGMLHFEGAWEIAAPVPLSLVCFRHVPAGTDEGTRDALNLAILEHVNASGTALLSHTKLDGRVVLRLAIGNVRTQREHVERTFEALRTAARAVRAEMAARVG
jgi:aromatic-L-amino-acid decarboxylase